MGKKISNFFEQDKGIARYGGTKETMYYTNARRKCVMHTYGGLSFYRNSYNMQHIKNQLEQAPTEGKEVINFNQGNELNNGLDYYSKIIENCRISESTSKFLACIVMLSDLYGYVNEAVKFMYGSRNVDEIIDESFHDKHHELESVLYGFLRQSVSDKLTSETIREI